MDGALGDIPPLPDSHPLYLTLGFAHPHEPHRQDGTHSGLLGCLSLDRDKGWQQKRAKKLIFQVVIFFSSVGFP